jgi:hypothetical protein
MDLVFDVWVYWDLQFVIVLYLVIIIFLYAYMVTHFRIVQNLFLDQMISCFRHPF